MFSYMISKLLGDGRLDCLIGAEFKTPEIALDKGLIEALKRLKMKNKVIVEAELVTRTSDKTICFTPISVDGIEITHKTPPLIWVDLKKDLNKSVNIEDDEK